MLRLRNLNPYDRHKLIINEYVLNQPGKSRLLKQRDTSRDKRDIDVIRENHKFLWEDEPADTWEKQLSRKYYDKLFKEYCISDLSRYKENKIALRWRTENEVVIGKGQFICGNKICRDENGLRSWEVNFAYVEDGERKNALVKLRLCPDCSIKLNYHSKKREIKRIKKQTKKDKKIKKSKKNPNSNIESDLESISEDAEKQESPNAEHTSEDETPNSECEMENETDRNTETENPWTKKTVVEELSREDEFEKYLDDLLL